MSTDLDLLPGPPSLAWHADDLAGTREWTVQLCPPEVDELVELASHRHGVDAGSPGSCPGGPRAWTTAVSRSLARRGVARVTGFPVDRLGSSIGQAFWQFASALGRPIPQGRDRTWIDVVENQGHATVRGSKTDRELIFHSDFANAVPDRFGLLVVRPAAAGGESLLASGHTAYLRLVSERPDLARQLVEDFWFDRTGDVGPEESPVIRRPVFRWEGGGLRVLYNRARIHRGHRLMGTPLEPLQLAALDALDSILRRPELVVRVRLAAGEAIFLDNHALLHSRTAFVDRPEPDRRRQLLRVWLAAGEPGAGTGPR